ncbi:type V CRISPR-associated protein Cas12b [Heliobacillus mobilis]|uniref:Type V CRISPR-associated protein Cas12b n=1 Tax=Heliobacterium mobile TaxID=28064 RepID=A0A6I3SPI6_HELMO|nr:type V CRISPR-associated protein Cas12b [Heliobacterium mobile]MTV50973.1 type V CRISPR-associated protein Cas12b [Heliobacterium mobile]
MKDTNNSVPRAYTMRLYGVDKQNDSWRDCLWFTHEAINRGAKAFGDWLLTFRGGLDHNLAKPEDLQEESQELENGNEEIRRRRRILAISWLSVESKNGAPVEYIVSHDPDLPNNSKLKWKTVEALRDILVRRDVDNKEIENWIADCKDLVTAPIREDAIWVNRSDAFDELAKTIPSLSRDEVWDLLDYFFTSKEAYFVSYQEKNNGHSENDSRTLIQKAGNWLSSRIGQGKKSDYSKLTVVYMLIGQWALMKSNEDNPTSTMEDLAFFLEKNGLNLPTKNKDGILSIAKSQGRRSSTQLKLQSYSDSRQLDRDELRKLNKSAFSDAEKSKKKASEKEKGPHEYCEVLIRDVENACGFTFFKLDKGSRHEFFSIMFDHGARKVSTAHTWNKIAEKRRQELNGDTEKLTEVPEEARTFLLKYCEQRTKDTDAKERVRIRKGAINGWGEVVHLWSKNPKATAEERIHLARSLQDDLDKFGDINLFEDLATEEAKFVWLNNGKPDPEILKNYVTASEARYKQSKFKVPAYRHPDPLLHPVFCDFGNSRPSISYNAYEAVKKVRELNGIIEKKEDKRKEILEKIEKNKNSTKNEKLESQLLSIEKELKRHREEKSRLLNPRILSLEVWDGQETRAVPMRWSSKQLFSDFALRTQYINFVDRSETKNVPRATRHGVATSNVESEWAIFVRDIFSESNKWNGRLQAPREQLCQLDALRNKDLAAFHRETKKINWFITLSAKLKPQGPWLDYLSNREATLSSTQSSLFAKENKKRRGEGRLQLCRLPGLRVLSVDLGHRYGAACAVWETVDLEEIKKVCQDHGRDFPKEEDHYLHISYSSFSGGKEKKKTIFYRRIGPDVIHDGEPHPAPWARLDRQFFIKLQGEEMVRKASSEELFLVHKLEEFIGKKNPLFDRLYHQYSNSKSYMKMAEGFETLGYPSKENDVKKEWNDGNITKLLSVDKLMAYAVRMVREGLRRHAKRTRIAKNLISSDKTRPGGRKQSLPIEDRNTILMEVIQDWRDLTSNERWVDERAQELWSVYIKKLANDYSLIDENPENDAELARLLTKNESLCMKLHTLWATRWREDDERWREQLRLIKDWIVPSGGKGKSGSIRHVGGLSTIRITTFRALRRAQIAYYTRPTTESDGDQVQPSFGQKVLTDIENMQENRVKQLVSRIVEAALGIGQEYSRTMGSKTPKRPINQPDDLRHRACHAVVIEDLTHYRPEETRTRRENRQLMNWQAARVKKYLDDSRTLHGIKLVDVSPRYTSRQDSRTGAAGLRCRDVSVSDFCSSIYWDKELKKAEKKAQQHKAGAFEKYILKLKELAEKTNDKDKYFRIPVSGGEIFVSADRNSPVQKGIHADLNAAANIGLRAITDPDWPGRWWYIATSPSENYRIPVKEKYAGVHELDKQKFGKCGTGYTTNIERVTRKKAEEARVMNLFRDVSNVSYHKATWFTYQDYWELQTEKVIENLRRVYIDSM